MLCMANEAPQLPDDLIPAAQAAREFNIEYDTLKSWWQRGRIRRWRRGQGVRPVYVRRSDVAAMTQIRPVDPPK